MRFPKSSLPTQPPIAAPVNSPPVTAAPAPPLPHAAPRAVPIAPRPDRGTPGSGNPRRRMHFGVRALPEPEIAPAQADPSGSPNDPEALQAATELDAMKAVSSQEKFLAYQADLLLRIGRIKAPEAAQKVEALLGKSKHDFAAHPGAQGHALNCIDITVSADELRDGRIPDRSLQGAYRAALRQFHFQKLQQALGRDPEFSKQHPVTQAELCFIAASVFNTSMGLGLFDFEQHNPQELQAGVEKARDLGLQFPKIAAHILFTDPSDFFAYSSQPGSPLKDYLFPESAGHELNPGQRHQMRTELTLGRPQGEAAHDYSDWFAQQAFADSQHTLAMPPSGPFI
jgi:hypothetical protein